MVDFAGMHRRNWLSQRRVFQERIETRSTEMIAQILDTLAEENQDSDRIMWAKEVRGPGFDYTRASPWSTILYVLAASAFWLGIVFVFFG